MELDRNCKSRECFSVQKFQSIHGPDYTWAALNLTCDVVHAEHGDPNKKCGVHAILAVFVQFHQRCCVVWLCLRGAIGHLHCSKWTITSLTSSENFHSRKVFELALNILLLGFLRETRMMKKLLQFIVYANLPLCLRQGMM
jgi:hypothetical protein